MKKIFYLALILPFLTLAQENRIGKVSKAITAAKVISGDFQSFEIFDQQTRNATTNFSEGVKEGVVMTINQSKINEILNNNPIQMNLTIPFKSNGETIALDLIQTAIFSPDFKAVTDTGEDITNMVDFGIHYRGIIAGNSNSLVSISVFENQISGFIANDEGNYTIGKLKNSNNDHIVYKDSDLNTSQDLICATEDDGIGYTEEELSFQSEQDPGDIVDIYVETGHSFYTTHGSNLTNTVAKITGALAQVYILYANDGLLTNTSSMTIWTNPDPYTFNVSSEQLNEFQNHTSDEFNADLGVLVEIQNIGGIAAGFSGICATNTDNSLSFAGWAGTNYANVPTFSFNVQVITHELGHLMGSRHTHACVWNGDNTAIDSCAGFTEGGCPEPGNPAGGGTIMSYCHIANGINFNLGFGAQPTAVILNNIEANGNCLNLGEVLIPPSPVCKTHIVILDNNGEGSIVVEDVDGGSYDDDGIVSMSIDIDTFDCEDVGEVLVTLTVIDTDGLSRSCIAFVEVVDNTEAVLSCPEDLEVTVPLGTLYELLDYQDDMSLDSEICNVNFAQVSQNPTPGTLLPVGVHEIRVSALLDDGSVIFCDFEITVDESLGLADNSILSSLILYPNPTVETLYLSNPENLELNSISIYDMIGRFIKMVDLKEMGIEQSIDVSELSESNYFVIIQGTQNKIIKQLIIK